MEETTTQPYDPHEESYQLLLKMKDHPFLMTDYLEMGKEIEIYEIKSHKEITLQES